MAGIKVLMPSLSSLSLQATNAAPLRHLNSIACSVAIQETDLAQARVLNSAQ
jgi:hypothetical protein